MTLSENPIFDSVIANPVHIVVTTCQVSLLALNSIQTPAICWPQSQITTVRQ